MCLPWNHKWETIERTSANVYDTDYYGYQIGDRPSGVVKIITQRCTHCGKEIVRKYRV